VSFLFIKIMSLKKAYLYLVSVISLVIAVVGAIMLLNMALKTWVFTKADKDFYFTPCSSTRPIQVDGKQIECTAEEEAKQKQLQEDSRAAQKQRDAAQALAMIIVATPVWYYHWKMARKEV
jgi:hypothetical protein